MLIDIETLIMLKTIEKFQHSLLKILIVANIKNVNEYR